MMKRKWMIMLLVCALLTLLLACSLQDMQDTYEITESGSWEDGIYTETAEGKQDSFEVTVTITDGEMSNITVGENKETPDKGGVAISTLPDKMLHGQTYDVDVVSGATVTSDGIKGAVARCLERASTGDLTP